MEQLNLTNIFIIFFAIMVIVVVCLLAANKKEGLSTTVTLLGGTIFDKYNFKDGRKTNVAKLMGTLSDKWVVLLHNNPFDQQIWYPLFTHMQHMYENGVDIPNLLAYDLKGHGTAWQPVDNKYNDANPQNVAWTMDQFAEDLYEVYGNFIGKGKITLVGYGFGGAVAQEFALKRPNMIEKLVILQTTIDSNPGVDEEIAYLTQWLQQKQDIYYLTLEEKFVQYSLCLWFTINDLTMCPQNTLDKKNVSGTTEYVLVQKVFREGSASTTMQIDKLLKNIAYKQRWAATTVDFPVILLTSDMDPLAPIEIMSNDFKVFKNANPESRYIMVPGKHGYTVINPNVIAGLL